MGTSRAHAQAVARWRLVEDLRIPAERLDLTRVGTLLIDSRGGLVLTQPDDYLVLFVTPAGSISKFGREGEGPGEFRNGWLAGWIGDTIWVSDPTLKRTTIIGPDRKLLRTVSHPTAVVGPGNAAESTLRSGALFPLAMLPGDKMVVYGILGVAAARPAWAEGPTPGASPLMLVNSAGRLITMAAWRQPSSCGVQYSLGKSAGGWVTIPFCSPALVEVSSNGAILVTAKQEGEPRGSYRVSAVTSDGKPIYSTPIRYTPAPISRRVVDSTRSAKILASEVAQRDPAHIDALRKMRIPDVLPPYRAMIAGDDGRVWIEAWTLSDDHQWTCIDKAGRAVGTFTLPKDVVLRAVRGRSAWATQADADGVIELVRYSLP